MYIYLFIYLTDFVKTAQAEVKKKKKALQLCFATWCIHNWQLGPCKLYTKTKAKKRRGGKAQLEERGKQNKHKKKYMYITLLQECNCSFSF